MIGEEIKIIFEGKTAFLTPDNALTLEQLDIHNLITSFKASAFWTVKILNYLSDEKKIVVDIISYEIGDPLFKEEQLSHSYVLDEIEIISFLKIDTALVYKTSQSTTPHKYFPKTQALVERDRSFSDSINQFSLANIIKSKPINFSFPIKKIQFKNGHVSFEYKNIELKKNITVIIPNENILEEFDSVKNYFEKVLDTKKIKVKATIETVDNKTNIVDANSPEIDKIDKTLIDNLKIDLVKKIVKTKTSDKLNKILLTMEACLENLIHEKELANTLFDSEEDFFKVLLQSTNEKHYHNLRFLSSKHAYGLSKLLFVTTPFSFVFLIEGIKSNHLVWETLDTEEATYIWQIQNS